MFSFAKKVTMLKISQVRKNAFVLIAGGVLVMAGMLVSHRPEAIAVSPLPNTEELSAMLRRISAEAIPSVVFIE